MNSTTIAVDLAKSVFQIAVSHHPGKVAESHRLTRGQFLPFFAERQPARVVMEACGTAHYWGRRLAELGHEPVLLPPHALRPYVSRNKTDSADARALLEAQRNEDIHPVPIKTEAQQTLMALHRIRATWMRERVARLNLLRAALRELGWVIPLGARHVVPKVELLVGDPSLGLPEPLRAVLPRICEEIRTLEKDLQQVERQLRALAAQLPVVQNLLSIPGIGLITATALVAFVGDVRRFPTSRRFASYLGLTPREHSSGLVRLLGRISKRGDVYLRTLLIHGARAVLWAAKRRKELDRLRAWALQVERLRGHNRAAVALANKMARVVWAVWKNGTQFEPRPVPPSRQGSTEA
jgi:transposase